MIGRRSLSRTVGKKRKSKRVQMKTENITAEVTRTDRSMIDRYLRLLRGINVGTEWFGGVLLVVMSLITLASVLSRYVANVSFAWIEEGAVFIMVWVVVFGASLAIEARHMIAVEALASRFFGVPLKILKTLVGLISMAFISVLIWAGWNMTEIAEMQFSPTLPWLSMFWVYVAIPVGGGLMLLNFLGNTLKIWTQEQADKQSEVLE